MKYILGVITLIAAIPIGMILRHFTKEEIKPGKKYFMVLLIISLILAIASLLININLDLKLTMIFSLLFIAIVSFVSFKRA